MKPRAPFQPQDLAELDVLLLDKAVAVVPMREIAAGKSHPSLIGLRHDVDNEIESSVQFAQWEHDRGYRSTYYILHTADYWNDKTLLRKSLEFIVECGHEIGIHSNAIAAAVNTKRDPRMILAEAIGELRTYGFDIRGSVAHGDPLCRENGLVRFVNDELFTECARPELGEPERSVAGVQIRPVPMKTFGLDYDANWVTRGNYLSDSGGVWSQPFEQVAAGFPFEGQLHMLVHACWWPQAFVSEQVAA